MKVNDVILRLASDWAGQEVTEVTAFGSDWAGSTEDGWHSTFEMTLKGPSLYKYLEGEELNSFWTFVMASVVPDAEA